jgi:hydroxyacylglutathione hydrolase
LSIRFDSVVVGPIETNCYVLWDESTLDAAIIDPGGEDRQIVAMVGSVCPQPLKVQWILHTHGHFDHIFSTGAILRDYNARTAIHPSDVYLLEDGLDIAALYHDMSEFVPFEPFDLVEDGQVIELGQSKIEVIHTPGHSRGCVCYMTDAGVFSGDTVFAGSIGRTDFPEGSHPQIMESIRNRIMVLDDSTPLMPGHGPFTTVEREKRTNPFFQG